MYDSCFDNISLKVTDEDIKKYKEIIKKRGEKMSCNGTSKDRDTCQVEKMRL